MFGLGAVLAAILTGDPPYVGESFEAVRSAGGAWQTGELLRPARCFGRRPELVALCKTCLAFEPADRPADAAQWRRRWPGCERRPMSGHGERRWSGCGWKGSRRRHWRSAELRKRRWLVLGAAAVVTAGSMIAAYRISVEKSEADRQRAEADKQKVAAEHNASIADEERGLARKPRSRPRPTATLPGNRPSSP